MVSFHRVCVILIWSYLAMLKELQPRKQLKIHSGKDSKALVLFFFFLSLFSAFSKTIMCILACTVLCGVLLTFEDCFAMLWSFHLSHSLILDSLMILSFLSDSPFIWSRLSSLVCMMNFLSKIPIKHALLQEAFSITTSNAGDCRRCCLQRCLHSRLSLIAPITL